MRTLRFVALAAVVAIAGLAQAQAAKKQVGDHEKLIGAWHLAHIDLPGPDGKPIRVQMFNDPEQGRAALQTEPD